MLLARFAAPCRGGFDEQPENDRAVVAGKFDEVTPANNAAAAFEELRSEMSLLHAAIEGLAAAKEKLPDYSPMLRTVEARLDRIDQQIKSIHGKPAMWLPPMTLAAENHQASRSCGAEDRKSVGEAREALARELGSVEGVMKQRRSNRRTGPVGDFGGYRQFLGRNVCGTRWSGHSAFNGNATAAQQRLIRSLEFGSMAARRPRSVFYRPSGWKRQVGTRPSLLAILPPHHPAIGGTIRRGECCTPQAANPKYNKRKVTESGGEFALKSDANSHRPPMPKQLSHRLIRK